MKILSVSCRQFAGVVNLHLEFPDGLSVVYGPNESGKSTLIGMLYALFCVPVRGGKRKVDAGMFPTGGFDTVDAAVRFQSGQKIWKLEKTWERSGRKGTIRLTDEQTGHYLSGGQAEQQLAELTRYGSAVYRNLFLGQQKNEEQILAWCADFFAAEENEETAEARQKVRQAALSAAGGIAPEKLQNLLQEKITAYGGKWDPDRGRPESRSSGALWKKAGLLVLDWQERDRAEAALKQAQDREKEIQELEGRLQKAASEEERLGRLQQDARQLENQRQLLDAARKALQDMQEAAADWQKQESLLQQAQKLKEYAEEQKNRKLQQDHQELLQKLHELAEQIRQDEQFRQKHQNLSEDLKRYQHLKAEAAQAESLLKATQLELQMHLPAGQQAAVRDAFGSNTVHDSVTQILQGYVQVDLPSSGRLTVRPKDLDIQGLEQAIASAEQECPLLLQRYGCQSEAELVQKKEQLQKVNARLPVLQNQRKQLLQGRTLADIEAQTLPVLRGLPVPQDLAEQIARLLRQAGMASLDGLLVYCAKTIEKYESMYQNPAQLQKQIREEQQKAEELQDGLPENQESMPADLDKRLTALRKEILELTSEKAGLEATEADVSELQDSLRQAEQKLQEDRQTYQNYLRIQQDLERLNTQGPEERYRLFLQKFDANLQSLTGGRVHAAVEDETLRLQSGPNTIPTELLSGGTRQSVMLAFRLALLEYFSEPGDSFLVLDDDLLEMDQPRRQAAARLLQDYARHTQILYMTCQEDTAALLGGKQISLQAL